MLLPHSLWMIIGRAGRRHHRFSLMMSAIARQAVPASSINSILKNTEITCVTDPSNSGGTTAGISQPLVEQDSFMARLAEMEKELSEGKTGCHSQLAPTPPRNWRIWVKALCRCFIVDPGSGWSARWRWLPPCWVTIWQVRNGGRSAGTEPTFRCKS